MTDEDTAPEGFVEGMNTLFDMLRKSASVKMGAIMFGQAQVAYYDVLKASDMSDEQAYNMLAHTTETVVRAVASSIAPIGDVLLKFVAVYEAMNKDAGMGGKEMPS